MSSDRPLESGKTVLLLDDNIGTGSTMSEIQKQLVDKNVKSIISGAVQYNWRNYFRVSIGEKKDIDRFEVNDFDIVTPFNYAGHKLYKHAIDLLHSSGNEYIEYLNSKSYRKEEYCDLVGSIYRSLICASRVKLNLAEDLALPYDIESESVNLLDRYKDGPKNITNPISSKIIKTLIYNVMSINDIKIIKERSK